MRVTPRTEKEIEEMGLWQEGLYPFKILKAEEQTSNSGNEMIKLTLEIYNQSGQSRFVYDYLLDQMAFKVRHAAEACGLLASYDAGQLQAYQFEGKTGTAQIVIQKSKDNNYPDKNTVRDYIVKESENSVSKSSRNVIEELDDDIPF